MTSFRPDGSTGLYPPALFMELLEREIARARRYARPLSIILGRPKAEMSDQVLSQGWMALARDVDFGSRLDESRWAMALPETGRAGASVAAERFRRGLESLSGPQGCAVSLGVVTHPYHGATATALLDSADNLSQQADSAVQTDRFGPGL